MSISYADSELRALNTCVRVLLPLTQPQRERILRHLAARWGNEQAIYMGIMAELTQILERHPEWKDERPEADE